MATAEKAEKISITLPQDMLKHIKGKVQSGHYASTSEVIREAMRLWQQQQEEHEARIAYIKTRIERSMNSGDAIPLEEAFAKVGDIHRDKLGEHI
jgi:antitoxin ParD1/3/4